MKLTILMPVFNTKEEYLKEAIESILNQTFKNFELLIINDGSTNNAEEVILSYNDTRIRYISQENKGISYTRNKGIELANGEYIAFMDSDDISLPTRLEKQVNFLAKNPKVSIVGTWLETFPKKQLIKMPKTPKVIDFLVKSSMNQATVMFKKNDFLTYNLKYNENLETAEDYELWTRAIKVLNFANIQEKLYRYRFHEENITIKKKDVQIVNDAKIKYTLLNSLTENKKIQNDIINSINKNYSLKLSFIERLFSIKNRYVINKKFKIIHILGIKFEIVSKEIKGDLLIS